MRIRNLSVQNEGYIYCKSAIYSAQDVLSNATRYVFSSGINKMVGEIDSGNWGVSYLISMYRHRLEDFILFDPPNVILNDKLVSLNEISEFSCYMDRIDPMFSTDTSVIKLVMKGLEHNHLNYSCNDIKDLFQIDSERFARPIAGLGNEVFKAMAAIAFSNEKEIFCFPWLSNKRFCNYHENLTVLLKLLDNLNKTVILPVGMPA